MWEGLERERERREARCEEKTPPLGRPWATIESEWGKRQRKEGKGGRRLTLSSAGTGERGNEGKGIARGGNTRGKARWTSERGAGVDHINVGIAPGSGVLGVQLCLGVGGRGGMQGPAVLTLPLTFAPSMA